MATFRPVLDEPRAFINVREGVVDESPAQWLTFAGETALELGAARAGSRLVGAEATAADVDPEADYGQFTETFVGPFADPDAAVELQLSRELDLTRIAAARKQGALSPERTRAAVNLALKEAINRNPLFASSLRERAERFLQAGAGGGSGSIFAETPQEKLERGLQETEIKAMQQEEIEAAQMGRTVEELRDIKYIYSERDAGAARMEILSQQQTVFAGDVSEALGKQLAAANLDVLGSLTTAVQQGGYGPEAVQQMKAGINNTRLQLMNELYSVRGKIPGEDWNRLKSDIDHWTEAANTLVDDADFASLISKVSGAMDNAVNIGAKLALPELAIASTLGESVVEMQLKAMSDPTWAGPLENVSPRFRLLRERQDRGMGVMNNMFAMLLGQPINPEHEIPTDGELTLFGLSIRNGTIPVPPAADGSDKRVKEGADNAIVRGSLTEGDTRPLSVYYRDPSVIADVRTSEHAQAGIRNAVQRHGGIASRIMRDNDLNLADFRIEIDDTGPGVRVDVTPVVDTQVTMPDRMSPGLTREERRKRAAAREAAGILKDTLSLAHTFPEIAVGETGLQDWLYDNIRRGGGIPRTEAPQIDLQPRRVPDPPTERPDLPPEAVPLTREQRQIRGPEPAGLTPEELAAEPPEPEVVITPEQEALIRAESTLAGKRRVIRELGIDHPDIEAILRRYR